MIHTEYFIFNELQTRCCLVWDDNGLCAVIDPAYTSAEGTQ